MHFGGTMLKFRHFSALIVAATLIITPTVAQAVPTQNPTVQPATLAKFTATPVPTVSGRANVGTTLTVNVGNWIPAPDTTEIKWMVGSTVVGIDPTYTVQSTDRGKNITVSVTAAASGYQSVTKTSAKLVATGLLAPSGDPQIASVVHQGDVLTASVPTFDPVPSSVKYQWYRAGVAIAGATKVTYTSVAADLTKALTFKVTATLASYDTLTLTSNASEPVVLNGFGLTNAPTLSNTSPTFGNVITGSVAAWSPVATTLSYQWFRDTTAIAGATKISYTAAVGDIGHALKLRVIGSKTNYTTTALFSDPTDSVIAATLRYTATPSIAGTATQGVTLAANTGVWTPTTTKLTFQWLRDDAPVAGAIAKTYKLVAADATHVISVRVTAALAGYTTEILTSAPTSAVLGILTKTVKPVVVGALQVGNELTVNTGAWLPTPDSFTYSWFKNGVAIPDSDTATYEISLDDFGGKISVKITSRKSGFQSTSQTSAELTAWPTTKVTISAAELFDSCTNYGDATDYNGNLAACDMNGNYFWFNSYAQDGSAAGAGFRLVSDHWGMVKWRVTLNAVKKPVSWSEFDWYAVDPYDDNSDTSRSGLVAIKGTYPSAGKSITTGWSTHSINGDVEFEIWSWDYADLYISSVTLEYYADTAATDPNGP
jgi:hypothetical protein